MTTSLVQLSGNLVSHADTQMLVRGGSHKDVEVFRGGSIASLWEGLTCFENNSEIIIQFAPI